MTTQDCADTLNQACGERIFSARTIRQRVEDGELAAVLYMPKDGRRQRARIEIAKEDFKRYVAKHHPDLLPRVEPMIAA